ncbi:truncated uncharacterised protein VP4, partial [Tai Forest reovirus]
TRRLDVVLERMVLTPDDLEAGSFPIHTHAYKVSLVDGCDLIPFGSAKDGLSSGSTFSTTGVITGQLKEGFDVKMLAYDRNAPETVTVFRVFLFLRPRTVPRWEGCPV